MREQISKIINKKGAGVTLSTASKMMELAKETNDSLFLWGDPGLGKSAIPKQLAKEKGWEVIDVRLAMMQAVDLMGLPFVKDGNTHWALPSLFPKDPDWEGIIFLDEANQCSLEVQKAMYRFILDRSLNNYQLPKKALVLAAGNKPSELLQLDELLSPLANRFTHTEIIYSHDEWIAWAKSADVDPRVIGFIESKPEMAFDRIAFENNETVFATPRSWERVSDFMKRESEFPKNAMIKMIEGRVGAVAGQTFRLFCEAVVSNKDVALILSGSPVNLNEKDRINFYAVIVSLSYKSKAENCENVISFLEGLKEPSNIAFAIKTLLPALKKSASIRTRLVALARKVSMLIE